MANIEAGKLTIEEKPFPLQRCITETIDIISTDMRLIGLMLKRANYQVDFAGDGLKAVEMWETGEYDLVLMDVQMPRLNGHEATRAIREKERARGGHTPIVAVTAPSRKEDEESCLAAGMDAYISKPVDFTKCLQLIGQIIKRSPPTSDDRGKQGHLVLPYNLLCNRDKYFEVD